MKKLVFRKVKIVKDIPTVDLTRWRFPREIADIKRNNKAIAPKIQFEYSGYH